MDIIEVAVSRADERGRYEGALEKALAEYEQFLIGLRAHFSARV
jgi:hypothetical protein